MSLSTPPPPDPLPGAARRSRRSGRAAVLAHACAWAIGLAVTMTAVLAWTRPASGRPVDHAPAQASPTAPAGQSVFLPTPLPEHYALASTWDTQLPTGPLLFHPEGIDIDSGGVVVVAETGNHRLTRAGASGVGFFPNQPPQRIGKRGNGPGEFEAPEDVAVTEKGGRIYVADTGNRRVQVLDTAGKVLGMWTDVGRPRGIALGPEHGTKPDGSPTEVPDGRVYVSDAEGMRVLVLDAASGRQLAAWGGPGRGAGQLDTPLGLSVGPDGLLYVADHGNERIQWWDALGRQGPEGAVLGALGLDNVGGTGGAPYDVAVDVNGDLYATVDRGTLRFRGRTAADYIETIPAMKEVERPGGSGFQICREFDNFAEPDSHEGTRRLTLRPGAGLLITYAPSLRWLDRVQFYPGGRQGKPQPWPNEFLRVWPRPCRDGGNPEYRHTADPSRVDVGDSIPDMDAPPWNLAGIDSSDSLRTWRNDGRWYPDQFLGRPFGPALDVTTMGGRAMVLRDNVITRTVIPCLCGPDCNLDTGCPKFRWDVLDPNQMIRRDKTNQCLQAVAPTWPGAPEEGACVPDDLWWHVALDLAGPNGPVAILNAGYQQLVIRTIFGELQSGLRLNAQNALFRSFRDLDFDKQGNLWVLAKDGAVQMIDARGRPQGEVVLLGLAPRTAEAIGMGPDGAIFVLTGDGWVFKFALEEEGDTAVVPSPTATATWTTTPFPPRATKTPTPAPAPTLSSRAAPVAAWRIADQAGPGRYRDVAVSPDGKVLVPDGAHDRILVFAPAPTPPVPTMVPNPAGLPCRFEPDKSAAPSQIRLGETVDVKLQLLGDCGPAHAALDVVVVLDASCQMGGERLARAREAVGALADAMVLSQDRIGLVAFDEQSGGARVILPLTSDRAAVKAAGRGFTPNCRLLDACFGQREPAVRTFLYPYGCLTEGRISDGLRAAREALFGPAARPAAGKAVVLLSPSNFDSLRTLRILAREPRWMKPPFTDQDFTLWLQKLPTSEIPPVADREHALWEAWQLWGAGVRVFASGLGQDPIGGGHPPDQGLLSALTSPGEAYRLAALPRDLVGVFDGYGRRLADRVLFASITITDRVPANMRFVPGSDVPPAEVLPDGGRPNALLRWSFGNVPLTGLPDLTYRLEPLEAGHWPTNLEALAAYTDGLGYAGRLVYPVPYVDVLAPTPAATATDEATPTVPPTPTPRTPPPTATRTSTPSPTPRPTGTPRPTRTPRTPPVLVDLFLPIVYRQACQPSSKPVDVALVLDTSSSMAGEKLRAAQDAARSFLGQLDFSAGRDRATVVKFNATAQVVQGLTNDRPRLEAALAGLSTAIGTRIDLGLEEGLREITGPARRRDATRVIVILTDGRPQGGTENALRAAADLAQTLRTTVYAVGMGADVVRPVLEMVAGAPSRVFVAPTPGELAGVYRQLAGGIVCQ